MRVCPAVHHTDAPPALLELEALVAVAHGVDEVLREAAALDELPGAIKSRGLTVSQSELWASIVRVSQQLCFGYGPPRTSHP